ncbi:MAG: pyruvate formate-lyase 1-activating enzyme, partial [Bacilli bacterium]
GIGKYEELLPWVDLILFDVKHVDQEEYRKLTGTSDDESFRFLKVVNALEKEVWVRQVVVPGLMDQEAYLEQFNMYLKKYIQNVTRIDFLPYHKLGSEKYEELGIVNPYREQPEMDPEVCQTLYQQFLKIYQK